MPRIRILAGAVALALAAGAAQAGTFDNVVVIGDSLSDDGNISLATAPSVQPPLRFTTNPGTVAIENVASHFGFTLAPSLTGGTDFAFGGAGLLNNSPGTPATVPLLPQQFALYLAAAGGKADAKTLYSVWGGANDIFFHATMAQLGAETAAQAQAGTQAAAQAEVALLNQMAQAGARYVVVFNLPDIGKTPSGLAGGAAASQSLTGLSIAYNTVLNNGLASLSGGDFNIIPVNTFQLISEVIANPAAFGFANVTAPACTTASSLTCTPATLVSADAAQKYLFADGVHPTTAAHAMLGQFVIAEIIAPQQISLLAQAPQTAYRTHARAIGRQQLADYDRQGDGLRWFASFDYDRQRIDQTDASPKLDTHQSTLTVGADAHASDSLSVGMALSIANQNADFAGGGGFKLQDVMFSGYGLYRIGQAYVGAIGTFGSLAYNDIDRSIQLGPLHRTESGEAPGSQSAFEVNGGYRFRFGGVETGPFAGVAYQHARVGTYSERAGDSSSMWFARQNRESLVGRIGWDLMGSFQAGGSTWRPYAAVAFEHESNADPYVVRAGSSTMNGSFELAGYKPDASWINADLGVSADFGPNVTGYFSYSGRFSDSNQRNDSLNLGLKMSF